MSHKFNSRLDLSVLEELYGNDYEYAMLMFDLYLESIDQELARLKEAIETAQREMIRQVSHKIKPVFLMVGLSSLNAIAKQLESGHGTMSIDELSTLYGELLSQIELTKPILIEESKKIKRI